MKRVLFGTLLFLTPAFVFAAGFAKQSIFLSTTAPMEGQTILIHASISNPATSTFNGTLTVKDEASEIGSVPVKLEAGGADDVSVTWKPTAGTHTVIADLKDSSGAVVEEGKQSFTIAAAPASSTASPASPFKSATLPDDTDIQSSEPIQQSITNFSPTVAQYSSPIFKAIDSGRASASDGLHTAIDWSKAKLATTSTKGNATQTASNIFATAALYILTVLLYIVGNVGVFYPLLAGIFLYVLWRLYRRYRRR